MSADLTLPGDLPGMLKFGSPVRSATDPERIGVVVGTGSSLGRRVLWCMSEALTWTSEAPVLLDLTDPTGRVHAAWWAWDAWRAGRRESLILPVAPPTITEAEEEVLRAASLGRSMDADDIATLRALCLRLAGRTP